MDNFSVTVAVPCYNGEKFISENITSILTQTRIPDEILVIDDGCTDKTPGIVKGFRGVKLIQHLSNKGLAASRNTALMNASSDVLVYLDADTRAHPKLLETLLQGYSADDIAGVGGRAIETTASSNEEENNIYNLWRHLHAKQGFGDSSLSGVNMLWGLCSSYRKKALERAGGFDPVYKTNGEDVDIGIKINKLGLKLVYLPEAIVYHNRNDNFDSLKEMLARWYFWGYIAKRRNNEPAFFNHLKIILFNFIKNIIFDLIIKRNAGLAFLSLKASGIELMATFKAFLATRGNRAIDVKEG